MLSAAKCRRMILIARYTKYMRIFAGVPSEREREVHFTISANAADERGVCILGTCRCVLLATLLLATFKINIRSFDQCAECVCVNSFRIKSAQSSGRSVNNIMVE